MVDVGDAREVSHITFATDVADDVGVGKLDVQDVVLKVGCHHHRKKVIEKYDVHSTNEIIQLGLDQGWL